MAHDIKAGDRVTFWRVAGTGPHGVTWKLATGRAVMRGPCGWVLNMGGRYGTPAVAEERSIVRVTRGKPVLPLCTRCGRAIRDAEYLRETDGPRHLNACPMA